MATRGVRPFAGAADNLPRADSPALIVEAGWGPTDDRGFALGISVVVGPAAITAPSSMIMVPKQCPLAVASTLLAMSVSNP